MLQVPEGPNPALRQSRNVTLNSPLALIGTFIYVVRGRFYSGSGLKWTWLDNKTSTQVTVESQWEKNTESRDSKPGIYIDRGQSIISQVSVGYQDQYEPNVVTQRLEQKFAMYETDILIDVVSPDKGESITLSYIVQEHLQCMRDVIMRFFTIQNISPIILNRTEPFQKDQTLFNSPITFRVTTEFRYAVLPAAPILREIELFAGQMIGEDGGNRAVDLYLQSLSKP